MLNATAEEEQRIKEIKNNLTKLFPATKQNIIYIIKPFLALLKDPKNYTILNHRDLYPYFAALIKDHSAILKGLGLINAELVFQGGATPLKQLIGIYKLALFTFKDVQQEQSLEDCLNDYSFSAQHGNLDAAAALIQYYLREFPQMPEGNFEFFVRMVNKSVFSDPTVLQASGFFLSAQLYYQISQYYLKKELAGNPNKLESSNAFRYFQKAILHYIIARHLLRAGHGQEPMPLVVTEKDYPNGEDEKEFMQYITDKVMLFKDESTVPLDCNSVARQACLKAESCAHEYSTRIKLATQSLNVEALNETIQKILNDLKSRSPLSYPDAYFSPEKDNAQAEPSQTVAEEPSRSNRF